jgi:hypothetical protein
MYFERTKITKFVLVALGGLFTFLTFVFYRMSNFGELIHHGYDNHLMRKIDTVVFFIFAILSFAASIVLHLIAKDAEEEIDAVAARISREIEKSKHEK